ncbi:MAG: transglutaminase-like domain-containing protein, partial [Verrucomicrobiota bacterium]
MRQRCGGWWRSGLAVLGAVAAGLGAGGAGAADLAAFVNGARARHGEAGERAARFLVAHLPPGDGEALTGEFLAENLDLALEDRGEFPWAREVPEDLFHNDVLPYAVFDEPRDPWRADFLRRGRALVRGARSASEAAHALNRGLFNEVKVHYHTGRKRPNQSPRESMESGRATCTGLSILLVDACRAVGIPARAVGTPLWSNGRGNHTWVEIWDGAWHFAGAD